MKTCGPDDLNFPHSSLAPEIFQGEYGSSDYRLRYGYQSTTITEIAPIKELFPLGHIYLIRSY